MVSRKILASLLLSAISVLGFALSPAAAGSGKNNAITGLEVQPGPHATEVVLRADATPTFTVFKLKDPDRLVVDLLHTEVTEAAAAPRTVDDARIGRIAVARFDQAGTVVSRLIIGLKDGVRFHARAEGQSVVVTIEDANAPRQAAAPAPSAPSPAATPAPAQPAPEVVAEPAPSPKPSAKSSQGDFAVVESVGDKAKASELTIRRIGTSKGGAVTIRSSGKVAAYEVLEVYEPFRLVLDVYGAHLSQKRFERALEGKFAERVRAAQHEGKVRLVFDLAGGQRQPYRVERVAHGMRVVFGETVAAKSAPEKPAPAVKREPAEAPVAREPEPTPAEPASRVAAALRDLNFQQEAREARVILDLEGEASPKVVHADDRSTVLEIEGCSLPVLLERTLDTSEFGSALQSLSAYRVQGEDRVRLVAVTRGRVSNRLERRDGKLNWVFDAPVEASASVTPPAKPAEGEYAYAPDEVAGYSVRRPELASGSGKGKKRQYTGRRISLDFKDADVHNILRLISDVAKVNIITSDEVKGTLTITMRNVPWDQALDIILKTKKLGKVRHGNIIRIAPLAELAEESEMAVKAAEARRTIEPLRVRLIPVNFATASDVEKQVKELLSERGSVTIDKRTNVLIVKDVLENLIKAEGLVRSLDTETPQVLIEARIVEANTQYLREIGIQWGGNLGFSAAGGNPTGLPFPNSVQMTGGADDSLTNSDMAGTANPGHFAINMPAAVGAGSGGAIGFIFGSASGTAQLNLRLSALENKGAVKIVSAPKVTTLDNNTAKISSGVSIPISVVSAAGVNTMFVEARLQLEVTPHITNEGSVMMAIKVNKNEPDFSRTGAKGDPTILRKEAETQVLVRDGDTTVIGGIYTRKTSDTVSGIPVLSHIPILGWLFRNTKHNDERTELLIFITPRIVNRLQATVSQAR